MSVIAWDGKSIAADKRSVSDGLPRTTTKLFMVGNAVIGFVGTASVGLSLVDWYAQGADPTKFPTIQATEEWMRLIVAVNKECYVYETTPHPIKVEDRYCAWGTGRDFALAAMHCGKTAEESVRIASLFDTNCGNGTTTFKLGDEHDVYA
jgi:ATP-dependent protease HslVU (ClpYQ) peptidase subunit